MSVGGGAVAVWRLAGMDGLTRPAENFDGVYQVERVLVLLAQRLLAPLHHLFRLP